MSTVGAVGLVEERQTCPACQPKLAAQYPLEPSRQLERGINGTTDLQPPIHRHAYKYSIGMIQNYVGSQAIKDSGSVEYYARRGTTSLANG